MKALVVGGGIAGPAAALALQQAGIEPVVLEAWPRSDGEAGSWFTLASNGLHALDLLGARHLVAPIGFPSERNVMVGATGRVLGTMSLGVPLDDGTVAVTMKRSRLAAALLDEAGRRGIDVRHDSRVVRRGEPPRRGHRDPRGRVERSRATCSSAPTVSARWSVAPSTPKPLRRATSG